MTTERWVPVANYEGLYEVSNLGRVRSLDRLVPHRCGGMELRRGRILKPNEEKRGYHFVSLCRDGKRQHAKVHHLVARAFLPASEKPEINHKDLNKQNNTATNLEWATPKENTHHRLVGEPGLSAAEASARMQAIYAARAKPPAVRHPKVKPCAVCGALFTPPATKRATQQACSRKCAGVLSGIARRKPGSTRFATYAPPELFGRST